MAMVVYTTLPDESAALALARSAVAARLAACAHVERITSVFEWQGIQEEAEWRVMFKTRTASYDALAAHVLEAHPYDEPALWAFDIDRGAPSFLAWIDETAGG